MADNRKITHGVRMDDGTVITDVDELEEKATPAQIKRLTEAGSIEGSFKGSAQPSAARAAADAEAAKKAGSK